MTANARSSDADMPDLERLAEEMERAMAQARKATAKLPPLEELAALEEAMAGLAQMGALTEKTRLAAQEHQKLLEQLDAEAGLQRQGSKMSPDDGPGSGDDEPQTG